METTVELPDTLFQRLRDRAARQGREVKDLLTEYVEQGLARSEPEPGLESAQAARRRRGPLPEFTRAAATGQAVPALTNAEIAAILDEEDAQRVM
jgi:plasmid stability protein